MRAYVEDTMDPVVHELFAAGDELAAESDVVVGHFLTHPAWTAARKRKKPYVLLTFQPVVPSRHYAPIGVPELGPLFNAIAWKAFQRITESIFR